MSNLTIELLEEKTQAIAGLPHLSLQLEHDINVAVQLKFVRETLVLAAERITQMPNVHPSLMGLVEHRSNVFWVLDLPQLLGFTPLDVTASDIHIAILQIADMFLGLGVYRVGRVKRFTDTDIQLSFEQGVPLSIVPFLRGLVIDSEEKIYLLNAEAFFKFSLNSPV
ncbi:MAG: hypothetical protein DCF19_12490 [Pseudanabaena frigida]|uniref:CheW-like domain-containing protein n=1 Tax=Pseudanabaena frigida TaxID=945775 RepID=A0A2W4W4A3_9CYAN|nr:MAG: hypothetical protein DCF19_12490 [Pseudanabaena frigida]